MDQLPPGMMRTITLDFPTAMEHIRVTTGTDRANFAFFLRARCCAISKNELLQNFGTHTSLAWLHLYLLNTFWEAMLKKTGKSSPSPWAQPAKTARWDLMNGPNDVLVDSEWVLETGRCYIGDGELVDFLSEGARPALPGTAASGISLYVGPHLKARKSFLLPRVTTDADDDDENARRPASPTPASRALAEAKVPPAAPDSQAGKKRWPPTWLSTRNSLPPPKFQLPALAPEKKRKVGRTHQQAAGRYLGNVCGLSRLFFPRSRGRCLSNTGPAPEESQNSRFGTRPPRSPSTGKPDLDGHAAPSQENSTGTTSQQPRQLRQQPEKQ